MENLFRALSQKYGGAEVRDVKFIVNPNEVNDQDVDKLDALLADAVLNSTPLVGPQALG